MLIAGECKGQLGTTIHIQCLPEIDDEKLQVSIEFFAQWVVHHELKNALHVYTTKHNVS